MHARIAIALVALAFIATSCTATPTLGPPVGEAAAPAAPTNADLSRFDSMQQLINDSFLPEDEAACVVDRVFFQAGVYNLNSPEAASVDQAAVIAGCTFDGDYEAPDPNEPAESASSAVEIQELEVETGDITRVAPFELTADTMPAIAPGEIAVGEVKLGGKTIDYVTITPRGFEIGDRAPVFFALPPGGQDIGITRDVAEGIYAGQALHRGWVVVTPASPGGRWFDDDNAAVVPELISWMNAWVKIEGGRPHLGGMSNGGLSAFHIIAQDPTAFQSVLAYPGFPNSEAGQQALPQLANVPVRMWVGGDDPDWLVSSQTTLDVLEAVGADATLKVYPGESHVITSLAGGSAIFNALESLR